MNIKLTLAHVATFSAIACLGAISGTDSLAIGNMAGLNGSANRTVVIGSGAGAYMTGGDSNLFVGAASGLRTKDVKSSVGLGHYAFRGATNCTRCVGIGDLAFKNANGLTDATWINGQFYADPYSFWISPDGSYKPIDYSNGTLIFYSYGIQLNAQDDNVTINGRLVSTLTKNDVASIYDEYAYGLTGQVARAVSDLAVTTNKWRLKTDLNVYADSTNTMRLVGMYGFYGYDPTIVDETLVYSEYDVTNGVVLGDNSDGSDYIWRYPEEAYVKDNYCVLRLIKDGVSSWYGTIYYTGVRVWFKFNDDGSYETDSSNGEFEFGKFQFERVKKWDGDTLMTRHEIESGCRLVYTNAEVHVYNGDADLGTITPTK